eukprot:824405-Heterocapsa_arctica.AAC.1
MEHEKKNEFGAHHLGHVRPWLYGNEGQEGRTWAPCDWSTDPGNTTRANFLAWPPETVDQLALGARVETLLA